jgi:uncharacterized membrane protein YgdD (TMEM256/DUF423 family)
LNTQKTWIIISGISGFLGVALGAFGAHILKNDLIPENIEIYKTGVFYQLIHTAVILAIALFGNRKFYKSNTFFASGILLFSFSLYLYSVTSVKLFAMITPIGGVLFLAGWLFLIINSLKKDKES